MFRRSFPALAVCLAFARVATALAQETVLPEGWNFPEQIGSLKRGEIVEYEKKIPGGGIGAHYTGEGVKLSIFVYTNGKSNIPAGARSSVVTGEVREGVEVFNLMVEDGSYSDLTVERSKRVKLGGLTFLYVAAAYAERGVPSLAGFYVTGWRNRLVKIRITCRRSGESTKREVEDEVAGRVAALFQT